MNDTNGPKKPLHLRPAHIAAIAAALLVAVILTIILAKQQGCRSEVRQSVAPENATAQQALPPTQTEAATNATDNATDVQPNGTDAAAQDGDYPHFEENLGVPIERLVRQVDYAITESLVLTGYGPGHLTFTEITLRRFHGEAYHHQKISIELDGQPRRFVNSFEHALGKWVPEATLTRESEHSLVVGVMGIPTHEITLTEDEDQPSADAGQGRMAIVIDDMGDDQRFARKLAALPYPVTFSILPHTRHAHGVGTLARDKGLDALLHLPMEPRGYPGVRPGPGALFTSMSNEQILATLQDDLEQLPGVQGVNNHMGSKFTQDSRGMSVVMGELKHRGLFFLDSLTTPASVADAEGRAAGIAMYKRNIFLDNVRDVRAIRRQLEKAQRVAASTGQSVAIGHPYPETLKALQDWADRSNRTVRMVRLSALEPTR